MLHTKNLSPQETRDARKNPLSGDQAWELLQGAHTLYLAKGKTYEEHQPTDTNKEALLKLATGRTGNLRAPTLKIGDTLVIGYSDSLYNHCLGKTTP